ncbi:SWIM zinc finger family protein [Streptomyces griseoviridis]|uniref:SWIM zinc finger family protein n=1 Tax=Streptomyces griseoviridis TaxID=45398 RepID=UPI0033E30C71
MSTEPPTEHRCAKCNRLLRNPSPDGLGPKCRRKIRRAGKAPELAGLYKEHQLQKAVEHLRQGGLILLRKSSKNRVYVVVSSDGATAYRTARAACTCPAGLKAKYVCWHRIAAHIFDLAS